MHQRARAVCLAFFVAQLLACSEPRPPEPSAGTSSQGSLAYVTNPELAAESAGRLTVLWDGGQERPRRIFGDFAVTGADAESAARGFLSRHASLLKLRPDGRDLSLAQVREGLAGTYIRFQQVASSPKGDAPLNVLEGQVIVLVSSDFGALRVRSVNLAHRAGVSVPDSEARIGAASALGAARTALGHPSEDGEPQVERAIGGEPAQIVYRVRIGTQEPAHAFEALVSEATGEVLSIRDRLLRASGTGYVFDPNPIATTGMSSLMDNGDATSPELDAARYMVTLENLDGSGFLRGNWADVRTKNANGRAVSPSLTFLYTRADSGFEETNAYFHIDRAQSRMQALGILNANASMQEAISDGQQGDNSYYDPMKDIINYGQGGVDDAEDADIVLHEYGHAIQDDQVPNYGAGAESGAMGEGFGDYFAASMSRVLSPVVGDAACIAEWDAVVYSNTDPPCLRRIDGVKHYPEHAVGQVHDDGEMWSSALFDLDTMLGADTMNRIVLEAHFSHSTTESFFGASQSLLDVDAMLFGGVNQDAIRRRMIQQGLSRILSSPAQLSKVAMSIDAAIENPLQGGTYADLLDDTQTFTHPGALGLRAHFTKIDTELDPSCLDGACDNLYLTGKDGDLYQILSGQSADSLSVVIPGDTIHFRLVTDQSVGMTGYHVDRIDVMEQGSAGTGGMGGMGGMGGSASGGGGAGGMGGSGGSVNTGGMGGSGGSVNTGGMGATGGMLNTGGMGGVGGQVTGSGGAETTGSGGEGGTGTEEGGCGCQIPGGSSPEAPIQGFLGAAFGALLLSRRRRRS